MRLIRLVTLLAVSVLLPMPATAQTQPTEPPVRITTPPVIVTAQKEPADIQKLPLSVTAVPRTTLEGAGITAVGAAAIYAPNTYFTEFTARKLSIARFRGIGSSPANSAVTTYIDGVPQLNTNSSSIEFLDVDQVEFVRGSQSALFGRNTLGGLVNMTSLRPSLDRWTGSVRVPFGNFGSREVRANVSGPLSDSLALGFAFGRNERDGFTVNDVTGHDLDSRSTTFGKAQLLWTPAANWETRAILTGERARDGDYGLNDLAALRLNPHHAGRDFEGKTDRDVLSATFTARREGERMAFSTTTGVVRWKTHDLTDADYTPMPAIVRDNKEEATQFSEELRLASAARSPLQLSNNVRFKWQTGVVFFTQAYEQDAVNSFAPFVFSRSVSIPVSQHSPRSALDDFGVGFYAQGTVTFLPSWDVMVGARVDHEKKDAELSTFMSPAVFPGSAVSTSRSFSDISPQIALTYRPSVQSMVYASLSRGFKAGGFNPASPVGSEAFGEEQTWQVESGMKRAWAEGRVVVSSAVFTVLWEDLQVNLPNLNTAGQFYVANVGSALSSGVELEINIRPHPSVELFSMFGYTNATFRDGSVSDGFDVSNRELPNTPDFTATFGGQYSKSFGSVNLFGRAEVAAYGPFYYDDRNTEGQDGYAVSNFRVGGSRRAVTIEAWILNAFDSRFIPVAFTYPGFAPSGFVGESGRPRTAGLSAGIRF